MQARYQISGVVQVGAKRGIKLGFPTANIPLTKTIPEGIYASHTMINQKTYLSATFIGASVTFGEKDIKSETYIFDFGEMVYGKKVTIKLFKRMRVSKKFQSEEALITQMQKDIEMIKAYFAV